MNNVIFYVVLACIIGLAIWVTVGSKKKQWYMVYLANNEVLLLCRDINERWWRSNGTYMRFKDELGNEVSFIANGHWILKMVSIPTNKLEDAKAEIKKINANVAKEQ
jgi:hypothetical protein